MRQISWLTAACAAATALQCGTAGAQQAGLEEIVVTAQKREELLQDVPMSVSAFSKGKLETAGVTTTGDLPTISPGVTGSITSSAQPLLAIRGISSNDFGIGGDPALGIYVDEVYAGRSAGAVREIIDLQRIEVLKGPQGTLFGRNTTAGAINFVTVKPSQDPEARVTLSGGNWSSWGATALANGPLSPRLSIRGSVVYRRSDGDRKNGLLDRHYLEGIDRLAGRIAGRWQSQGAADWVLTLDGERDRDSQPAYKSLSLLHPQDPDAGAKRGSVYSDLGTGVKSDRDLWGATLRGEVPFGELKLTSITAARGYKVDYAEDTDGTYIRQLHFYLIEKNHAFTQEFRLGGETDRLTWFAGVAAYIEEVSSDVSVNYDEDAICTGLAGVPGPVTCDLVFGGGGTIVGQPNQFERSRADGNYRAYAAFTDLKWALSEADHLTLGLRLTRDEKRIEVKTPPTVNLLTTVVGDNLFLSSGAQETRETWTEPTARLVLDHSFGNRMLGYVSGSHGYKSGGFNALQATGRPFDPEFVNAYELGLKSTGGGQFTFDAAGFYYQYKDLQVQVFEGGLPVVRNAANATGYGADLSGAIYFADAWTLDGFATWLSAKYDKFVPTPGVDYKGNRLNRAPEYTFGVGLNWDYGLAAAGRLVGRVGYVYQSRVFFTPNNSDAMSQSGYGFLNARVACRTSDGRFEVALKGENLSDTDYVTHGQAIGSINLLQVHPGHRRSYGVELTGRW